MGAAVGKPWARKPDKILLVGLDAAGKSTILHKHCNDGTGEVQVQIPTIGFVCEHLDTRIGKFVSWDVGGRCPIRPLWKFFGEGANAAVFVVDANDRYRFEEARDELGRVLELVMPEGAPVLILANKMDLPGAASPDDVAEAMGISSLHTRPVYIKGVSAATGDGLNEAFAWLTSALHGGAPQQQNKHVDDEHQHGCEHDQTAQTTVRNKMTTTKEALVVVDGDKQKQEEKQKQQQQKKKKKKKQQQQQQQKKPALAPTKPGAAPATLMMSGFLNRVTSTIKSSFS